MTTTSAAGAPQTCPMCAGAMELCRTYSAPPEGEMRYAFLDAIDYYREYHHCRACGHFLGCALFSFERLYAADYVDSVYGGLDGIRRTFARIMAFPPEKSDNFHRVAWIAGAMARHGGAMPRTGWRPKLLDVGFGLGVFPAAMKAAGWEAHGLDLDERQVEHARDDLGIAAHRCELGRLSGAGPFDLVTFNKVLEHVERPQEMLGECRRLLAPGALVYVELPDGEAASREGFWREEFFVEHIHVFSVASYALLARKAGFEVLECVRVREPSSKYTLRGLLRGV